MSTEVPARIGSYEVLGIIGRGGMATVYKAIQPSLHRIVAIKVLPRKYLEDPVFVERFNREAQAVAMMNHPNIVQIIDKDRDGDLQFFVMEYVPGVSLQTLLGKRRLTLGETLNIAKEVGKGLQCAHRSGIVHRDLNPRNILLSEDLTTVKIADFGISRVEALSRESGTLTTAQTSLGTLYYYAPEQAENPTKVDHRADIYSLGVVCYEMLTGKVPVGKFSLPSQLNQSLPPEIDRIVLKCLSFEPAQRYATVGAFLEDIDKLEKEAGFKLLDELKGLSRSTSNLFRRSTTSIIKRRKAFGLGALVVVGMLLVAFGVYEAIQYRDLWMPSRQAPVTTETQAAQEQTPPQASEAAPAAATAAPAAAQAEVPPLVSRGISDVVTPPAAVTPGDTPAVATKPLEQGPLEQKPAPAAAPATAGKPSTTPARGAPARGSRTASGRAAADAVALELAAARAKVEAGELDPAVSDLRAFIGKHPSDARALDAWFLIARAREQQNRSDDAVAAYAEIAVQYRSDPRSAEALVRHAQLLLKNRGKDQDARALLAQALQRSSDGEWALQALWTKAAIEERLKAYERDPALGSSSPSALITYRTLAEKFPNRPQAETALWKIGDMYEDLRRYEQAAQAFVDLGTRFPETKYDAWYRAGDLLDKRLDRPAQAKEALLKVPKTSSRFQDAQRRAARMK